MSVRVRRPAMILLALGVVVLSAVTMRLFVWPDLTPPPAKVDAVIELGGPGERDGTALALARAHRAPYLVQSTTAAEEAAGRCLPAVPEVTILCFHPDPGTTRGEARGIGRLAALHHWRSVILVTTRDHAWRATFRVSRCFSGAIYVATSPLPALDWFWVIPYQWVATAKAVTVERGC